MMFILMFILNWMIKMFVAWLMYLLATWLQLPEWAVITLVAVGATETHIKYSVTYR